MGPAVAGITYFEFLGTLVLLDVILVGKEVMGLDDLATGMLDAFAGLGIGGGSFVAGRLSGDRVELGLVPFGAIGVGLTLLALAPSTHSYAQFAAALALVGFCGGLVAVPLYSLLQQRAGTREKGRLMATNNFANMSGVLMASGALWLLREVLRMPADGILPIAGIMTLAVSIAALRALPEYPLHAVQWVLDRGRDRPRHRRARTYRLRRLLARGLLRGRRRLAATVPHEQWVHRGGHGRMRGRQTEL
jgi:acyl-[acyl-carrier-protein]-phospholipid O-acyltransferase/long-chain-fatty-acid--[acyl-carrier-protein] ligase